QLRRGKVGRAEQQRLRIDTRRQRRRQRRTRFGHGGGRGPFGQPDDLLGEFRGRERLVGLLGDGERGQRAPRAHGGGDRAVGRSGRRGDLAQRAVDLGELFPAAPVVGEKLIDPRSVL